MAAVAQYVEKAVDLSPIASGPHAEVSLGKTLKPELILVCKCSLYSVALNRSNC